MGFWFQTEKSHPCYFIRESKDTNLSVGVSHLIVLYDLWRYLNLDQEASQVGSLLELWHLLEQPD